MAVTVVVGVVGTVVDVAAPPQPQLQASPILCALPVCLAAVAAAVVRVVAVGMAQQSRLWARYLSCSLGLSI